MMLAAGAGNVLMITFVLRDSGPRGGDSDSAADPALRGLDHRGWHSLARRGLACGLVPAGHWTGRLSAGGGHTAESDHQRTRHQPEQPRHCASGLRCLGSSGIRGMARLLARGVSRGLKCVGRITLAS